MSDGLEVEPKNNERNDAQDPRRARPSHGAALSVLFFEEAEGDEACAPTEPEQR